MPRPIRALVQSAMTLAALLRGAVAYLLRRRLPDPMNAKGARCHFRLASVLALGFFTAAFSQGVPDGPKCYESYASPTPHMEKGKIYAFLRTLWKTLDLSKSNDFAGGTQNAVKLGYLKPEVASMLRESYDELAHHAKLTEKGGGTTCYKMNSFGFTLKNSRERVMVQLKTLRNAVANGTIPPEVAETARKTLRLELAFEHRARKLEPDPKAQASLLEAYQNGLIEFTEDEQKLMSEVMELESKV